MANPPSAISSAHPSKRLTAREARRLRGTSTRTAAGAFLDLMVSCGHDQRDLAGLRVADVVNAAESVTSRRGVKPRIRTVTIPPR